MSNFHAWCKQHPMTTLKCSLICDGHTIFNPEPFTRLGMPKAIAEEFTEDYDSDGTPKGTISKNGKDMKTCRGIYGLRFLKIACSAFDLDYPDFFGRGRQAQAMQSALMERFSSEERTAAAKAVTAMTESYD